MKKGTFWKILGIIAFIAAICGILYALYRYFQPQLDDEFADDLDDAFGDADDDEVDFDDDIDEEPVKPSKKKKAVKDNADEFEE